MGKSQRIMQTEGVPNRRAILLALAAAAILAYLPALTQPFIEDDFHNIALAARFGPIRGWADLAVAPRFAFARPHRS